jgi:hypothetical protein
MEELLKLVLELLKIGMVAIGAGLGAYGGAYLKAKAEHWATHEDIDEVLNQVRAVTTTTKVIEAKISEDVWDRQKRWELKRDVLFEATRRLAVIEEALTTINSVIQVEHAEPKKKEELGWINSKHDRILAWTKASAAFEETVHLVSVVCQPETRRSFYAFHTAMTAAADAILKENHDFYRTSAPDRLKKSIGVKNAIRKELGIDAPASIVVVNTSGPV